jgi:hypothetical protein
VSTAEEVETGLGDLEVRAMNFYFIKVNEKVY